jgi:hypothetical protein
VRRVVLILTLCLLPVRAEAAIALVQSTTGSGSAPTLTWSAAPSSSNTIVMIVQMENETQTISVGGWTPAVSTLAGPVDSATDVIRGYIFCTTGDNADTTILPVASSGAIIWAIAVEVSGANSCGTVMRDTETGDNSATTAHVLAADMTVTAGDFIFAQVLSTNGANFTHDAGFTASIPAADAELNTQAQAEYLLSAAGGSQGAPFASSVNETTQVLAVALIPTAGGGGGATPCHRSLMGVGCLW